MNLVGMFEHLRIRRKISLQRYLTVAAKHGLLFEKAVLGVFGGLIRGPVPLGFVLHVRTPFCAADFRGTTRQ